jgi:hypothetical protein
MQNSYIGNMVAELSLGKIPRREHDGSVAGFQNGKATRVVNVKIG